jgi:hypothetical protein
LKKLMLLAALLAMLVVAAIPAIAQVGQEAEQDADSGELDQTVTPSLEGNNSSQCIGDLIQGNTGNAQSQNQSIQYASGGTASPAGNADISLEPEFQQDMVSCTAETNQAAAAG